MELLDTDMLTLLYGADPRVQERFDHAVFKENPLRVLSARLKRAVIAILATILATSRMFRRGEADRPPPPNVWLICALAVNVDLDCSVGFDGELPELEFFGGNFLLVTLGKGDFV